MNPPIDFPNDENGNVLRRMHASGDDLSQPRMMDFCFVFTERRQALAFAEIVDDRDLEVCISRDYLQSRCIRQISNYDCRAVRT